MPKVRLRARSVPLALLLIAACGNEVGRDQSSDAPDLTIATDRGAVLALACSGCHSSESGAIVSLDSYDADQMRDALLQYQSDANGTTVMHRLARGYSAEDIDLVSAYLGQSDGS